VPATSAAGGATGPKVQISPTATAGGEFGINGTGCRSSTTPGLVLVTVQAPGGVTVLSRVVYTQAPPVGPADGTFSAFLPIPAAVPPSPYYEVKASCETTHQLFAYPPVDLDVLPAPADQVTVSPEDAAPDSTLTIQGTRCKPGSAHTYFVDVVLTDPLGNQVASTTVAPLLSGTWTGSVAVPSGAAAGVYQVSATCGNLQGFIYDPTSVAVAATPTAAATTLTWLGPTTGPAGSSVALSAHLTSGGMAVAGQAVTMSVGSSSVTALTQANGVAEGLVTLPATGSPATTAVFAGNPGFAASNVSSAFALIAATAASALRLRNPGTPIAFEPNTLSAVLTSNGAPVSGRPVTFAITDGYITTATSAFTDSAGVARIPYSFQVTGAATVQAVFPAAGDTSFGPARTGARAVTVAAPFQPDAVSCGSQHFCVTVGAAGLAKYTIDAGADWSFGSVPTTANLTSVSCPTIALCVAVGTGGIILTSLDRGHTWVPATSPTSADLTEVRCARPTSCIAVGSGGTTLSSADGGHTWTAGTSSQPGSTFDSLACPTQAVCLATAHDPSTGASTTLLTIDAGATWRTRSASEPQGQPVTESSVTCLSASDCIAASAPSPSVTSDRGQTWAPAFASGFVNPGAVACGNGSCVQWDGFNTLVSADAGNTWSQGASPTGFSPIDLTCFGTLCVAVAGGQQPATAFVSTDDGQSWSSGTAL
jgi:photosystem II stability/assembly factor-like uncharacterized protein